MLRWDTGGGAIGIFVIGCAVVFGVGYFLTVLPTIIESISGILWWSFGK